MTFWPVISTINFLPKKSVGRKVSRWKSKKFADRRKVQVSVRNEENSKKAKLGRLPTAGVGQAKRLMRGLAQNLDDEIRRYEAYDDVAL